MFVVRNDLPDFIGEATLISDGTRFFVVSSSVRPEWNVDETMVFDADANGEVIDWIERMCVRPASHHAVVTSLITASLL